MCFSTPSPVSYSEFSPPPAPRRGQRGRARRDTPSSRFSMRPAFEAETGVEAMTLDHECEDSYMRYEGSEDDGDDELSEEEKEDDEMKGIGLHGVQHNYAFSLRCQRERNDTSIPQTAALPASASISSSYKLPAFNLTSANMSENIDLNEHPVDDHPRCPPPAPRLSRAIHIPSSSPNVPPPYVRRPIQGPIYYTWESPQRQVQDHIEEHFENQRRRREQTHYQDLQTQHRHHGHTDHQRAQHTTPRHTRNRMTTLSSGSFHSSPLTGSGVGNSQFAGNSSSPVHYGASSIYDTTGTVFSSPVPPKRGTKRHRDLVDDGIEE